MARLDVAPTKSNQLSLKRQLAFAEEGYELLEQKRQILVFELMRRLAQARELEARVALETERAHLALRDAELDGGAVALDRLGESVRRAHEVRLTAQSMMGISVPEATVTIGPPPPPLGVTSTSASADEAIDRFTALLPLIVELAGVQATVSRLAAELRKTQRRCNALSRIFIPSFGETLAYIAGALEERERESFIILKMVRDRLVGGR